MDPIIGKNTLFETIRKDLRHTDYDRVCKIAKTYTAYVTGENISELLVQFAPREDKEAFDQRVAITKVITPYMANRIMAPMFKAGRTIATINYSFGDKKDQAASLTKLTEALSSYYGDDVSVDNYLTYRMVELDCTDPNSFIVTELPGEYDANNPSTKSNLKPYPFEVSSKEAINYLYTNNRLQFLVVLNCINGLNRYTIYLENVAIVAQQLTEAQVKDNSLIPVRNPEIFFKDPDKKQADEVYYITTAEHKAGRIPAVRVGSRRDLTTRGRTRVPMMHPAQCFFEKSLQSISELDLTIALHAFPQKIVYGQVCAGDLSNNLICDNGRTPQGVSCTVCKGTGFAEHKSAQDVLRVKMPSDIKDVVSLDNFMSYKYPPSDGLEFMKKLGLEEIPELAIKAVYTSELFVTDQVSTTATEKNIDLESVYDAIKLFTDKWSNVYKHITTVIANYLSLGTDFVVVHKFPKDFKMKTLAQLMADLQLANTSGAPSFIKKQINRDIAEKLYIDKPDELLKIEIKEKFYPFNGKSETEIATIISDGITTKFDSVLYANFDMIFQELDEENSTDTISFWKFDPKKQRELLTAKVEQYLEDIAGESAAATPQFGADTGTGTQDYNVGDDATYNGQPVTIVNATAGDNGGQYTIQLADNSQLKVNGSDLTPLVSNAA